MPTPSDGQRRRRWAPKTRTGCTTCKIRRKKCDEKKPTCRRCEEDKFSCDGYPTPRARTVDRNARVNLRTSQPEESALEKSLFTQHSEDADGLGLDSETVLVLPNEALMSSKNAVLVRWPVHDSRPSDILFEPSLPWTKTSVDQDFTQHFLQRTAPLLSSTRRWRYFWSSVVPQAAWENDSVRHAMVATALTLDSCLSGTDHTTMVLSRRTQAVRSFGSQPSSSWEVGLIICRLFASMAQCSEEFDSALVHMKAGEKMLREACAHGNHRASEVGTLMAGTFMGMFADSTIDFAAMDRFPEEKRADLWDLKTMCTEYARMLRRMTRDHRRSPIIETMSMGFLSLSFTTLNQAISSAMYPEVLVLSPDDGIVAVPEIRAQLMADSGILSLDDLRAMFQPLVRDIEDSFRLWSSVKHSYVFNSLGGLACGSLASFQLPFKYCLPPSLRARLKLFVDNYVLQTHALEPRMTAGTFWHPEEDLTQCPMEVPLAEPQVGAISCLYDECSGDQLGEEDVVAKQRKKYYDEFVCHYRSGFIA
jgi:hypothetical protein